MAKITKDKIWARSAIGIIIFLFLSTVLMTGCEPLRKKFTRKRKKDQESEIMPVLDPIDYPARMDSPERRYRHFYSRIFSHYFRTQSQNRQAHSRPWNDGGELGSDFPRSSSCF